MPADDVRATRPRRPWSADRGGRCRPASRRPGAGPRRGPVEHVGGARRGGRAQGVSAHPARPQPGPRADGVPDRGGGFRRRPAAGRLRRGRLGATRHGDRRDRPGVRRRRGRSVRVGRRGADGLAPGPGRGQRRVRDRGRGRPRRRSTAGLHAALASAPAASPGFEPRDATAGRAPALGDRRPRRSSRRGPRGHRRTTPARPLRDAGADDRRRAGTTSTRSPTRRCSPASTATTTWARCCIAPDGYRIVDFEGEPLRARSTSGGRNSRRCATSRRCCARSTTSVAAPGAARRRATAGRSSRPAWTSTAGCAGRASGSSRRIGRAFARSGAPIAVDPGLLRAFEIDKEVYEFVYAATYLPSWLWAPTERMRGVAVRARPMTDRSRASGPMQRSRLA